MKQDGVTLIELLVVIAIGGILVIALGFEFVGWMARYRVESEIKTMQADLLNARQMAMEKNIQYVVELSVNNPNAFEPNFDCKPPFYIIYPWVDTNGNGIVDVGETQQHSNISKCGFRYPMDWTSLDLGVVPNNIITIDRRGTLPCTDPNATCTGFIFLRNPDTGNPYKLDDVDYDCILLSAVKINVGKYNLTTGQCDAK